MLRAPVRSRGTAGQQGAGGQGQQGRCHTSAGAGGVRHAMELYTPGEPEAMAQVIGAVMQAAWARQSSTTTVTGWLIWRRCTMAAVMTCCPGRRLQRNSCG